jgi:penicillin-binding protein 1B
MVAMYQTIASGGFRTPLRSIRDVVDARGVPLRRYELQYDRAVSLQAVALLQYAMVQVMQEGTGKSAYRYLPRDLLVAGKSGTTNDGRDSWFAGFSGDLLTVSWIGRDDNGGTGLTGSSGALKVWARFMAGASRQSLRYNLPDGVETHWVDAGSGYLTGEGCPDAMKMPFVAGSEPTRKTSCAPRKSPVRDWFQSLFGD